MVCECSTLTYFDGSFDDCASYDCVAVVPLTYLKGVVVAAAEYLLYDGWFLVVASDLYVVCVVVASCLRCVSFSLFSSFWLIRDLINKIKIEKYFFGIFVCVFFSV